MSEGDKQKHAGQSRSREGGPPRAVRCGFARAEELCCKGKEGRAPPCGASSYGEVSPRGTQSLGK